MASTFLNTLVVLLLLLSLCEVFGAIFGIELGGTKQSAAAKGKLLCGGRPYKGAKIRLWDKDTIDPDDLMGESISDEAGQFEVHGTETEVTNLDLLLSIYHNCEDETTECLRRVDIGITDDFIARGSEKALKTYDAGILNLSGHFPGEGRDCLNAKK